MGELSSGQDGRHPDATGPLHFEYCGGLPGGLEWREGVGTRVPAGSGGSLRLLCGTAYFFDVTVRSSRHHNGGSQTLKDVASTRYGKLLGEEGRDVVFPNLPRPLRVFSQPVGDDVVDTATLERSRPHPGGEVAVLARLDAGR